MTFLEMSAQIGLERKLHTTPLTVEHSAVGTALSVALQVLFQRRLSGKPPMAHSALKCPHRHLRRVRRRHVPSQRRRVHKRLLTLRTPLTAALLPRVDAFMDAQPLFCAEALATRAHKGSDVHAPTVLIELAQSHESRRTALPSALKLRELIARCAIPRRRQSTRTAIIGTLFVRHQIRAIGK